MIFICLFLLVGSMIKESASFFLQSSSNVWKTTSISMKLNGILVVGSAGGVAETVVAKLASSGFSVTALLDQKPYSPSITESIKSKQGMIICGEEEASLFDLTNNRPYSGSLSQLAANKLVIASDDPGDASLREVPRREDEVAAVDRLLMRLARELPESTSAVVFASSISAVKRDSKGGLGAIFGARGSDAYKQWCTKSSKPFSLLRYGDLAGGVPGAEPLPFVGLPLQEPELHPSYVLQSLLCSGSTPGTLLSASDQLCTREALAEVIARLVRKQDESAGESAVVDAVLSSIPGPRLQEKDWDKLFARMMSSSGQELLRVEFGEVLRPEPFMRWVAESWFPQALIDADAATILAGARPVRATRDSSGLSVDIKWEDIRADLTVVPAGTLRLTLNMGSPPSLSAMRVSGSGALPGDSQLMDRLIEEINKSAYKKKFCTPLASQ